MSALDAADGTPVWVGNAGASDPQYPTDLIESAVTSMRALALYDLLKARLGRTIGVITPAVASDWTITVPAGAIWLVQSVTGTLTTDANVGNRAAGIKVTDGASTIAWLGETTLIPASQTARKSWIRGLGINAGQSFPSGITAGLWDMPLLGGSVISSNVQGYQAGDQWSAVAVYAQEWTVGQVYWLSDLIARELGFETLTDLPASTPVPIANGQPTPVSPLAR